MNKSNLQKRIVICDQLPADFQAYIQALYSRSAVSIVEHIHKHFKDFTIEFLPESNGYELYRIRPSYANTRSKSPAANFLNKWAIQYNHSSILDAGTALICVEGCDIITAKALQHHPLYAGTEVSTRYVAALTAQDDLATEVFHNVVERAMHRWAGDLNRDQITKASIDAYAFDIAGGFLPTSTKTMLSLSVRLRTLQDIITTTEYIGTKHHYPALDVAKALYELTCEMYPGIHWSQTIEERGYAPAHFPIHNKATPVITAPPKAISEPHVTYNRRTHTFSAALDYRSLRDLMRHRTIQDVPFILPNPKAFPHPFYVETGQREMEPLEVPKSAKNKPYILTRLGAMTDAFHGVVSPSNYRYIQELRCGRSVHPTLRAAFLKVKDASTIHVPSYKRGTETIVYTGD